MIQEELSVLGETARLTQSFLGRGHEQYLDHPDPTVRMVAQALEHAAGRVRVANDLVEAARTDARKAQEVTHATS